MLVWLHSQGLDSGFGAGEDETYNVYDKAWRQDRDLATSIYRPSKNADKDIYGDDLDSLVKGNRQVDDLAWDSVTRLRGLPILPLKTVLEQDAGYIAIRWNPLTIQYSQ